MNISLRSIAVLVIAAMVLTGLPPNEAVAARKKKAAHKSSGPYRVSARAAILVDGDNLNVIYQKDSHRKVYPASTTKIMTAIVVLERLELDSYVTVSERATQTLPSKVELKAGEHYRVRDLLNAALLNSANDAAFALAEAAAGSEERFVELMNHRAQEIGAKNTLFANSHGLPSDDPQFTTAYDMTLIFREALKKPFFHDTIEQRTATIVSQEGRKIVLRSHNKALFKGWKQDIYGKTGYTRLAQACFVGYGFRDKKPIIIAVFGCSKRWEDVKFILERYGGLDL